MSTVDDLSSESGIRKAELSKRGGETGGEADSSSESGNMRAEQSKRGGDTGGGRSKGGLSGSYWAGLGGERRGLKA